MAGLSAGGDESQIAERDLGSETDVDDAIVSVDDEEIRRR